MRWLEVRWSELHVVNLGNDFENIGNFNTALPYTSDPGLFLVVKHLLDSGYDPNVGLLKVETLLHRAVIRGHYDVVHLLLRLGADVNAKNVSERIPLHHS
jgi:ankyrin repeat protein